MWHFDLMEQIVTFILISPLIYLLIKKNKSKPNIILFSIAFGIYIVRFIRVVFFPLIWDLPDPNFTPDICIIPFKTMIIMWNIGLERFVRQIIGNIALFVPMGFLLPQLFEKINSYKKILFISIVLSISVESIQLILDFLCKFNLKAFDINDILLNTIGGILGFAFAKFTSKYIIHNS